MKALTLTQPWATLVAMGEKRFETRSWPTAYRGPLAIHAAKGLAPIGGEAGLRLLLGREPFLSSLAGVDAEWLIRKTRGCVVATAELAYCLPTDEVRPDVKAELLDGIDGERELAFGDYSPGRYAWRFSDVKPLEEPVPCRGALGPWVVPLEVEAQLLEVGRAA